MNKYSLEETKANPAIRVSAPAPKGGAIVSGKCIGQSVDRVDGMDKITGAANFTDDIEFGPNLLHAEVIASPHAHALVKNIDASEAEAMDGVICVVTGKDFPGYRFGLYMQDRYIFAQDRVRFVGEQVAAVVANCPKIAKRAAKLVKVEYDVQPAILNQMEAFEEDAKLVHEDLETYEHVPWFFPKPKTNVAHWRKTRKGDIDTAFADADYVLEDEYTMPRYAHCAIETHVAVGLFDYAKRLTVWSSSQSPHTQKHLFAQALKPLGMSEKDVRVIAPYVGGGFGGKAGVTMEIIAAALATKTKGRPVKVRWSREQEFLNTYHRLGMIAKLKMGVKKDGTIVAIDHKLYWEAGAYVEYGANVVNAVGLSATGPYRIPNVSIDSICIYTHMPPGGAYRGFGYSEFLFGIESHIDRISKHLGIDPLEMRLKNAIKEGDILAYGAHMNPSGLHEALEKTAREIEWGKETKSDDPNKVIGKGIASFWKAPAMPPNASSSAYLKFNDDGSINVLASGMDIGQGFLTVMAQVAGEVLGVPTSKIRTETPDTDRNPYEWQTVASHITWSCGNAVKRAALDARNQIFDLVERALHLPKDTLYMEDECVKCTQQPKFALKLEDFVIDGIQTEDGTFKGGPIAGRGTFMPEFASATGDPETSQGGHPNVHYTVGCAAIEIEIDKKTGKVRVIKAVEAVDCGKALNPQLVEGQVLGGFIQGLATVLYEDMRFSDKGELLNPNFTDYKIPTTLDCPDNVVSILIETPQPDGPFGARGVGEHTMLPVAPMIANAIENALGVRIKDMPLTAEKIALAAANK